MQRANTYFIGIDDFPAARGETDGLRFEGRSPQALADAVRDALVQPDLFRRWRGMQEDPDAVDESLGGIDPQARVEAEQSDLHVDMRVTTCLPMRLLRHRLDLLIGSHWTLHDVRSA